LYPLSLHDALPISRRAAFSRPACRSRRDAARIWISRASPSGSARRRKPSATTAAPRSSLEEIRDRPRFSSPATNCIQMTSLRLVNPSKDYEASYRSLLEEFRTRGETLIPFPLSLLARHGFRDPGCF